MILLDTTVLSYAVGDEHPLRDPCRSLLTAHGDGHIEATTTIEVVQEFTHYVAPWISRTAGTPPALVAARTARRIAWATRSTASAARALGSAVASPVERAKTVSPS